MANRTINSTSINWIDGSRKGLKIHERIFYLILNYLNNSFPDFRVDNNLTIHQFSPVDFEKNWGKISKTSSPSRIWSNLFWMSQPWPSIKEELGEINVVDIGCGSGKYFSKLQNWSGEKFKSYLGIDAYSHENHQLLIEANSNIQFLVCRVENFYRGLPSETNLIVTQSAIEHFEDDLTFFQILHEHCKKTHKPVIQIHLFPPESCLHLYMFHGFRQYTPRTLSRITRLFSGFSEILLYKLGGRQSIKLHAKYIPRSLIGRWNNDLRAQKSHQYAKDLEEAVRDDIQNPNGPPIFYALIIHCNKKKNTFIR